jgi:hypothetical protein
MMKYIIQAVKKLAQRLNLKVMNRLIAPKKYPGSAKNLQQSKGRNLS